MFLSFIVPVYNVEKYLAECLDSLLNQDISHEDYEIICVNDGSTDGSLSILREYEKEYSNIRVINQPNKGVATARNVGLDAAVGEYVWFVDSDDFILSNVLRKLKTRVKNTNLDRVAFGSYVFKEKLTKDEIRRAVQGELRENCNLYNSNVFTCIMRRAYLCDNNHCFHYPELAYGEDCVFMYEMLSGEPCSEFLKETVYFYRQRAGSAMSVKSADSDKKRIESHVRICEIIYGYYQQSRGDKERTANCLMTFLWLTLQMIVRMPGEESKRALKKLKKMGLFPFKRPAECTIVKSYQTLRKDFVGRLFDWLYLHTHTNFGLISMRLWVEIEKLKHYVEERL